MSYFFATLLSGELSHSRCPMFITRTPYLDIFILDIFIRCLCDIISVTMKCAFLVFFIGLLPVGNTVRVNSVNCQQSEWHCTNNTPKDIVYSCSNVNSDVSTNSLFIFTGLKVTQRRHRTNL